MCSSAIRQSGRMTKRAAALGQAATLGTNCRGGTTGKQTRFRRPACARVQYHAAKTFQREKGALMGFLEDMQETLDRGVSTARGAVSGVAVEQLGFVKSFVRTCHEGWLQGWHEANGGNDSQKPPGTGSGSGLLYAHQGNPQPDTGAGVSKAYERGRLHESSGESQSEKGRP